MGKEIFKGYGEPGNPPEEHIKDLLNDISRDQIDEADYKEDGSAYSEAECDYLANLCKSNGIDTLGVSGPRHLEDLLRENNIEYKL